MGLRRREAAVVGGRASHPVRQGRARDGGRMNIAAMTHLVSLLHDPAAATFVPARAIPHRTVPWVPLGAGRSFKPLRFLRDDRGFVELLRLEPGVAIPLHRHTGETHAFNLEGTRELSTGEVIGPGDYAHEPGGNFDEWKGVRPEER